MSVFPEFEVRAEGRSRHGVAAARISRLGKTVRVSCLVVFAASLSGCAGHMPPYHERNIYRAGQRWRIYHHLASGESCTVVLTVLDFEKPFLIGATESDTCAPTSPERRIDLSTVDEMVHLESVSDLAKECGMQMLAYVIVSGIAAAIASAF